MTKDDADDAEGSEEQAEDDQRRRAGLQVRRSNSGTTLIVRFELDALTAPHFDTTCREIFDDGERTVEVDMRQTTFIDSSGLRAMLANHKRFVDDGGSMSICGASDVVARLLSITGLTEHFGLAPLSEG